MVRRIAAELLGTGLLVYFAVGVATLSFGFGVGGLLAAGLHRVLFPEPEPESLASGDIPPPVVPK